MIASESAHPRRMFVAMPLPDAVRSAIATEVESVRKRLPAASWLKRHSLHLTLAFLGDVASSTTGALVTALEAALRGLEAPQVRMENVSAFPDERRARVVILTLSESDELGVVAERTRRALDDVAVEYDRKPFHAHVTLARPRDRWSATDIDALRSALQLSDENVTLDRVVLYESRLAKSGATHLPEKVITLASR